MLFICYELCLKQVQLNLSMKAFLYNTTTAYYNCAVAHGACSLKMFFFDANAAVLTSPGPEQVSLLFPFGCFSV